MSSLLGGESGLALLEGELLLRVTLVLDSLLLLLGEGGLGADGGMGRLVHSLNLIGGDSSLEVLRELALERISILLLERLHVGSDVSSEDVLTQDLGVELGVLGVLLVVEVTGETTLRVGDVETSIGGTLHGSEDTVTSRGTGKTDIEKDVEGTRSIIDLLNEEVLSVDGSDSDVLIGNVELSQNTAGEQQTSGVGSGVVGQANLDSVAGELMGVGSSENDVSLNLGEDNLGDDVLVGETDDKTELGGTVLVEILDDQVLTSLVVSETLCYP